MSAFALGGSPAVLAVDLLRRLQCSPTALHWRTRGFGRMLEPRYIFRAGPLDQ